MQVLDFINKKLLRNDLPNIKPGDTVEVHYRVIEGEKERIQLFKGTVIAMKDGTINKSFTVRKISFGIGVERVFPFHSPLISKIEIVSESVVSRSKLYFLRNLHGKAANLVDAKEYYAEKTQTNAAGTKGSDNGTGKKKASPK